ncbi:MAG: hypothetical protein ACKE51_08480 [Methylococcaceae bacterium]
MPFLYVKAELEMYPPEKGKKTPIYTGYSPNHKFGSSVYFMGEIDFFDNIPHIGGETNIVLIKFADTLNLESYLSANFRWLVTEGSNVVGKANFLKLLCKEPFP